MEFRMVFILGFLILALNASAQMIKILPDDTSHISWFSPYVDISDGRILLVLRNSTVESALYHKNYYRFYERNAGSVKLTQKIPESYSDFDNAGKQPNYIPFYPALKNNYFFYVNNAYDFYGYTDAYLNKKINGLFERIDTVIISKGTDFQNFQNRDFIMAYSFAGNWFFIRKMLVKKGLGLSEEKAFDYFYKIENEKIVFQDSIYFRDFEQEFILYAHNYRDHISSNENFLYIGDELDDTNGQDNGSVLIYRLVDGKWAKFQTIYHPEPYLGKSYFGFSISASPGGKYLAVCSGSYLDHFQKRSVYIYQFREDKYELMQSIYPEWQTIRIRTPLSIDNTQLFIGDNYNPNYPPIGFKGAILHYVLQDDAWVYKSKITPPLSDIHCGGFGSAVAHEGETVVAFANMDTTYGTRKYVLNEKEYFSLYHGAAYVFQVPARDTLDVRICEGDSYWFGEEALMMSGVYRDTLLASYGVDSVVVLHLSVLPPVESVVDTILCPEQGLTVGDHTLGTAGYYTIPLKNINGCDSIVSVRLSYAYLEMEAEVSPDFGCRNGKISLLLQGNNPPYGYQWSKGDITSENLTDLSPGLYSVTVTDRSGCSYTLNDIEVKEEKVFELPDAFIPASQMEENRRFRPYLFPGFEETVKITEMDVFNRYGEKVYSGTDPMGWDGIFRGEPAPPGSYLYRILLSTPCGEEMRVGSLLLVR